jgi:hypothetical protein
MLMWQWQSHRKMLLGLMPENVTLSVRQQHLYLDAHVMQGSGLSVLGFTTPTRAPAHLHALATQPRQLIVLLARLDVV